MSKNLIYLLALFLTACAGLRKLPTEQYYPFYYHFDRQYQNDSIYFGLTNPLKCPVTIKLVEDAVNPGIENLFGQLTLAESQDTVIRIYYPDFIQDNRTRYIVRYGDPAKKIEKSPIAFPFPKGKEYKIIQGYNGDFSHNTIYSSYAIDFSLQIGDTITSVADGYVVGVIEDYSKYGTSKKWLENDKSNYLTIYHPQSGLFTQYVHLTHQGSLVKLGDYVEKGQAIGISGMTGYTTKPHLHFNVKIPTNESGLISTAIEFVNGIKGEDLKKNDKVK